jgi:hypothetical protein
MGNILAFEANEGLDIGGLAGRKKHKAKRHPWVLICC